MSIPLLIALIGALFIIIGTLIAAYAMRDDK